MSRRVFGSNSVRILSNGESSSTNLDTDAKKLSGINGIQLPVTKPYAGNVHWMYAILLTDDFPMKRDAFRAALKEKGVDTRDFFPSSADQPIIQKLYHRKEHFPVSERIAQRGLYLPSGLALTQAQIDYVCDAINSIATA